MNTQVRAEEARDLVRRWRAAAEADRGYLFEQLLAHLTPKARAASRSRASLWTSTLPDPAQAESYALEALAGCLERVLRDYDEDGAVPLKGFALRPGGAWHRALVHLSEKYDNPLGLSREQMKVLRRAHAATATLRDALGCEPTLEQIHDDVRDSLERNVTRRVLRRHPSASEEEVAARVQKRLKKDGVPKALRMLPDMLEASRRCRDVERAHSFDLVDTCQVTSAPVVTDSGSTDSLERLLALGAHSAGDHAGFEDLLSQGALAANLSLLADPAAQYVAFVGTRERVTGEVRDDPGSRLVEAAGLGL